jgi:hypothetical protein
MRGSVRVGFGFFLWMVGGSCCCRVLGFCCVCGGSLLAFPCFRSGLLALPLCGAALTFFAAAKKVSKESGLTPPALKRVPWLGGGSGTSGICVPAHSALVTKPSSAPTPHFVRRGWVCEENHGLRLRVYGSRRLRLGETPELGVLCVGEARNARQETSLARGAAGAGKWRGEKRNWRFSELPRGARSAAGRMTALSRTRSVREHRFQMHHCPLQARGAAYELAV